MELFAALAALCAVATILFFRKSLFRCTPDPPASQFTSDKNNVMSSAGLFRPTAGLTHITGTCRLSDPTRSSLFRSNCGGGSPRQPDLNPSRTSFVTQLSKRRTAMSAIHYRLVQLRARLLDLSHRVILVLARPRVVETVMTKAQPR